MTSRRFLLVFLLPLAQLCFAEPSTPPKTVRVLTVGNSLSANATRHLGALAKAAGDTLILRTANVGGASLERHWSKVEAFEENPDDKTGRYASGRSLQEELTSQPWDFVTIQQASIKSHDLATYRPFAQQLADYIRRHAPTATLLVHETWEYRVDDPRFAHEAPKAGEPKTQDEMYRGLASAYTTIAKEVGARLLPVGDAFHLANRDPQWGYHPPGTPFDPKTAEPGELPDQARSLNVGWSWKKQADGTTKLSMDGHHANLAGEYLGACVWYEVIFGRNVERNRFVPAKLDPEYARFLRATAHRAVGGLAGRTDARVVLKMCISRRIVSIFLALVGAALQAQEGVRVTLGEPIEIPHPLLYYFPDSVFPFLPDGAGGNMMFWTNGFSYRTFGPTLDRQGATDPKHAIATGGPKGCFDGNGIWMLVVHRRSATELIAFAHTENHLFDEPGPHGEWNYCALLTSSDNGATWTRRGPIVYSP